MPTRAFRDHATQISYFLNTATSRPIAPKTKPPPFALALSD